MRHITSRQALVGGAIALGALAALRSVANARERRHKISQGVLRPAQSLWTPVGEWRMHTHVALPAHPSAAPPLPSRIDRMVLIGPTTDPRGRSVSQLMMRFLIGGLFEQPSLNWLLVKDYARMRSRLIKEFNVMRADVVEVKLPHVEVPTMLVRGENDPIVPQRWLDEAARLVGAKRVAVIPHMGHALNYSAADELVATLLPFLAAPAAQVLERRAVVS